MNPITPKERARRWVRQYMLGKDAYEAFEREIDQAVAERDFEWWAALVGVDVVATNPEAVKRYVMAEQELVRTSTINDCADYLEKTLAQNHPHLADAYRHAAHNLRVLRRVDQSGCGGDLLAWGSEWHHFRVEADGERCDCGARTWPWMLKAAPTSPAQPGGSNSGEHASGDVGRTDAQ